MDVLAEPPVPHSAAQPDPLRAGDAGALGHTPGGPEQAFGPASPTAGRRQPVDGPPPPATPGRGSASKRALPSTPAEYGADIDREETQWSKVVKASGAKAE